jgi:hypothetical protein
VRVTLNCPKCLSPDIRSDRISEDVALCACSACRIVFTIQQNVSMASADEDVEMLAWLTSQLRERQKT